MKFKVVWTYSNAGIVAHPKKFEEMVNEALQQGWKLHGSVIAIPHTHGIEIYQPMVFEDEDKK